MVRPDYRQFIIHSARGSTWKEHKYIKRINGTYYYPDNYKGGRHLPDGESKSSGKEDGESKNESEEESGPVDLTENDVEKLAREAIRGNFGNGQVRKDLLGGYYDEVQKRVNEILQTDNPASSKKIKNVSQEEIDTTKKILDKVERKKITKESTAHQGVDMGEVLNVYKKDKNRG